MLDNRDRVRVKTLVAKARFSSRSEAGRYAANMRWKGQGKKTVGAEKLPKEYQRVVDRANKSVQGYRKTFDELESMKRDREEEIKLAMSSDGFSRKEATEGVDEYIGILEQALSLSQYEGQEVFTPSTSSISWKVKTVKPDEINDVHGKEDNMTTTAAVLDKLFGKGAYITPGGPRDDPYERKVTEEWSAKLTNPKTGKTFEVQIWDWMRYDELGMSENAGKKLGRMKRGEEFDFSIGTSISGGAEIVKEMISRMQPSEG